MKSYDFGHMIVHGETNSGKTCFTRHLLKLLQPDDIWLFTTTAHDWENVTSPDKVFAADFETNGEPVMAECKRRVSAIRSKDPEFRGVPFVFVFDDFDVDTNHCKSYRELWSRGRHYGIRVISLIQYSKMQGPLVRTNARYWHIMATAKIDEIKHLAGLFYNNDSFKLSAIIRKAREESSWNCVVFDGRTLGYVVSHASLPSTTQHPRSSDPAVLSSTRALNTINTERLVDLPPDSSILADPANAGYLGIAAPNVNPVGVNSSISMGQKTAHNMVDNSVNNFAVNHNIKMEQLVSANTTQNNLKLQNITVNHMIQLKQDVYDCARLLDKPYMTSVETDRVISTMNSSLRPKIPITRSNYHDAVPVFMREFHNRDYCVSEGGRVLAAAGGLLTSADPISAVVSGWNLMDGFVNFIRY